MLPPDELGLRPECAVQFVRTPLHRDDIAVQAAFRRASTYSQQRADARRAFVRPKSVPEVGGADLIRAAGTIASSLSLSCESRITTQTCSRVLSEMTSRK